MKLTVVTGNKNKAAEVAAYFEGIADVEHLAMDCPEYKGEDIGEIATGKARYAFEILKKPLITDDTGFFIDVLSGFPGPYAAYVFDTIGMDGILRLMENEDNRKAHFETAIAFADEKGRIHVFRGRIEGQIIPEKRGTGGFGYDPIFEVEGGKTMAELSMKEKSERSHRGRALAVFRRWVKKELLV